MSELKDALNAWTNLSRKLSGKEHDNDLTAIYSYLVAEQPRPAPVSDEAVDIEALKEKPTDKLRWNWTEQTAFEEERKRGWNAAIDHLAAKGYLRTLPNPVDEEARELLQKIVNAHDARNDGMQGAGAQIYWTLEAIKKFLQAPPQPSPVDAEAVEALKALDEGYPFEYKHGCLVVENPEFSEDNGKNPKLVINLKRTRLNTSAGGEVPCNVCGTPTDANTCLCDGCGAESEAALAPPQPAQGLEGLLERVPEDYEINSFIKEDGYWTYEAHSHEHIGMLTGQGKTPAEALTAALGEVG